jgi:ketosteroid isomerase-like protein
MSQENVEVVRRAAEAWSRGDLGALLAQVHPSVVWEENHPLFGFVGLNPVYEAMRESGVGGRRPVSHGRLSRPRLTR